MDEKRAWLIDLRVSKKLKQWEVAKGAGITQQFYSMVEKGEKRPSPDVAQRISQILDFSWTKFYE